MMSNIDSLQDISTNGKFDYVVMAQDWHCSSQETQSSTLIHSTFTWKFSNDDELCEGLDYNLLIPFGTCHHVRFYLIAIKNLYFLSFSQNQIFRIMT